MARGASNTSDSATASPRSTPAPTLVERVKAAEGVRELRLVFLDTLLEDQYARRAAVRALRALDRSPDEDPREIPETNAAYALMSSHLAELDGAMGNAHLDRCYEELADCFLDLLFQMRARAEGYREPQLREEGEETPAARREGGARSLLYGRQGGQSARRRQQAEDETYWRGQTEAGAPLADSYREIPGMTGPLFERWTRLFAFSPEEFLAWHQEFETILGRKRRFSAEEAFRWSVGRGLSFDEAVAQAARGQTP